MTRSKGSVGGASGFKIGYRGNNSRIDKILKSGPKHYKLDSSARSQRHLHTIGVYKNGAVVMMNFVLCSRADEERYWKLANKADRVSLDEENCSIEVYRNGKCKKFPIEL